MKMIFICSPLRGDIEGNVKRANQYCYDVAIKGDMPIAPHCVFTQYLDDLKPNERELGMKMGLELLRRCDGLLVCGDIVSAGMQAEIKEAERLGIPIQSSHLTVEELHKELIEESAAIEML